MNSSDTTGHTDERKELENLAEIIAETMDAFDFEPLGHAQGEPSTGEPSR